MDGGCHLTEVMVTCRVGVDWRASGWRGVTRSHVAHSKIYQHAISRNKVAVILIYFWPFNSTFYFAIVMGVFLVC